jgi:hypothetical protein
MSELNGKLVIDPDLLTPGDLLRAAEVTPDGQDPYELLERTATAIPLTIWCLLSKDHPSFTWEQALAMPFSKFTVGAGPPPMPPPDASGTSSGKNAGSRSRRRPHVPERAPSSASTSASPEPSTAG